MSFSARLLWSAAAGCLLLTVPAAGQFTPGAAVPRTITVSPVPGDPVASGTGLKSTLAGINAGADDRYLLRIDPGTYDLGTGNLVMKPYVDIEGSGHSTVIQGYGQQDPFSYTWGVVHGADNAELRNLNVSCSTNAAQDSCIAVINHGTSPTLRNVSLRVSGQTGAGGIWGMRNIAASPTLENVDILLTKGFYSYGIVNAYSLGIPSQPVLKGGNIEVRNATVGNYGILNKGGSLPISVDDTTVTAQGGGTAIGMWDLFESESGGYEQGSPDARSS